MKVTSSAQSANTGGRIGQTANKENFLQVGKRSRKRFLKLELESISFVNNFQDLLIQLFDMQRRELSK